MRLQTTRSFVLYNKSIKEDNMKRQQEHTTPGVRASSIGKRIPLLTPLLIPSFADYHSIVRLMNVSYASILASHI
jgi:hypothetical protein